MTETLTLDELESALEDADYPLSASEVRERYGDATLDLPGGEADVSDVLARVDDSEYDTHASLVASLEAGVGDDAVGKTNYSDRGGPAGENTE